MPLAGQEQAKGTFDVIPDPGRPAPAEVPYMHPLYRQLDQAPKLVQPKQPENFATRVQLMVTVKVEETGRVSAIEGVEPPLKALGASASILAPRWTFEPAKKDGRPVRTWASMAFDLDIEMERASFSSFTLRPVQKTDPAARVIREYEGDSFTARYPKEINSKEDGLVSVEDVDFIPQPKKVSWKFDSTRLRSRFTALVQVSKDGSVLKVLPVGELVESAIARWMRSAISTWKLSPAVVSGAPVDCWMYMEAAIEFDLSKAKERSQRSLQKNLKAIPVG
jgi:hypothetical protein